MISSRYDGLKKLIADLEARKAALHPDEGK